MGANTWTRSSGDEGALSGIKNWQGNWANSTLYVIGDGVFLTATGSTYICIQQHTSSISLNQPDTGSDWETYWDLVAQGSNDGSTYSVIDFTNNFTPTIDISQYQQFNITIG